MNEPLFRGTHNQYVVLDTKTKTLWETPKGKRVWYRSKDAKNAWMCQHNNDYRLPRIRKFDFQSQFVVYQLTYMLAEAKRL